MLFAVERHHADTRMDNCGNSGSVQFCQICQEACPKPAGPVEERDPLSLHSCQLH